MTHCKLIINDVEVIACKLELFKNPIIDFIYQEISAASLYQLYLSRLSLAKPVKLNFFKTPASIELKFLFQFPFIVYDIRVSSNYMQFLLDS